MGINKSRARSAANRVSSRELPGGSSSLMLVMPRSAAGTNPLGNRGSSCMEPTKNRMAARAVVLR